MKELVWKRKHIREDRKNKDMTGDSNRYNINGHDIIKSIIII